MTNKENQETITRAESGMSEDDTGAITLTQQHQQPMELESIRISSKVHEKIGVVPFAVIIFYGVSGGPFGVEQAVRSAGNFYTLLGFLIMPFVWSLQEALMTAELASVFPEASGGVAWVKEAFGDGPGWMCGFWHWMSGSTDNAIYPVLFVDYLAQLLNGDDSNPRIPSTAKYFLLAALSCLLAYTNWLGLPLVGKTSMTICLIAMSPFIILSLVGIFQVEPSRWFEPPEDDTDPENSSSIRLFSIAALTRIAWAPFMNNMFWNLNSFDSAASFAADIEDPSRTLPRAMKMAFFMVSACYFVPLLVSIGATSAKQSEWEDGYLSIVAETIAGPWLGGWLVFAAAVSNIALFQAELSSDAFQLMGMAERGFLPKILATRSRHGTPTYGILIGLFVILCMTITDLASLIEMLNFNYALALIMEYMAFLALRIKKPDMERPYRIPLSTRGCFIAFTPTLLATVVVILLASWKTYVYGICTTVFGVVIFLLRGRKVWEQPEGTGQEQREEGSTQEVNTPPMFATEMDDKIHQPEGEFA